MSDPVMRVLSLILSAFLLTAATPPVPEILKPYIKGDRFDPGDYKWMKGRFQDATAEEKAQDKQVRDWLMACYTQGLAETRAELRALGIVDPLLKEAPVEDALCSQVAAAPHASHWASFSAFQQSLETAVPIADTYLMAVGAAKQISASKTEKLHDLLMARPVGEQMLRYAGDWRPDGLVKAPAVPEPVGAIIRSRLMAAGMVEDHENAERLKQIVAKQGWPKRSEVGDDAAGEAWLLVQHADADPAFQLTVLRAMEPLLTNGDMSKTDYAYLYDRVMLKITGKQRYGTQAMCDNGKRVSQPLEDEKRVDRLRAEVGLAPVAEYLGGMDKRYGRCPPGQRL
ncbi:DUF6624 domain-containing protein [Sphingomonas parapaucimobilis]|uniref:DUF6624 domain-containing protein n=1 Tax=Sphingomonas parapaucimobilis TaxID=28213 RepID=UPI0035C7A33E